MADPIQTPELANRLARAIASDIALYHHEKIENGIKNDNLFDSLQKEIAEGSELYKSRVAATVFQNNNYFERAIVDIIFKRKGEQIPSKIW